MEVEGQTQQRVAVDVAIGRIEIEVGIAIAHHAAVRRDRGALQIVLCHRLLPALAPLRRALGHVVLQDRPATGRPQGDVAAADEALRTVVEVVAVEFVDGLAEQVRAHERIDLMALASERLLDGGVVDKGNSHARGQRGQRLLERVRRLLGVAGETFDLGLSELGAVAAELHGDAFVEACLEEVGRQGDRFVEERQRLGRPVALHRQRAEAVERIGVARRELDRFPVRLRGLVRTVHRPQHVAGVVVRAGVARIDLDRFLELAQRRRRLPGRRQRDAEDVVRLGALLVEAQRRRDRRPGLLLIAELFRVETPVFVGG